MFHSTLLVALPANRLNHGVDHRGNRFRRVQARPYGRDDHPPAIDSRPGHFRQGHVPQPRKNGETAVFNDR